MTREELREYVEEQRNLNNIPYHVYSALINGIDTLEQELRKGHWIEHPHEAGPNWKYSMYECSECHGWAKDVSDYCPDCGTDMKEVEE